MRIEKEEFEKTVDRYSDALLRSVYTYCHDIDDAKDIVQETFIKYLKTAPDLIDEKHRKAWLLRTAINLAKDQTSSFWATKRSKMQETADDSEPDPMLGCEIWLLVSQLPAKDRLVIELYYREDCTLAQIAEITGSKPSTIASRLEKARKRLKKMYNS